MRVFIVGPGGVGKTTSGKILADKLGFCFIDLDQQFSDSIENISEYIRHNGYEKYCYTNSELFYSILNSAPENFIFVLSSGFLVHENCDELIIKHKKTLSETGLSVVLLPSESLEESTEIVVNRQLQRGFALQEDRERVKFVKRYSLYRNFGDVQIFSCKSPENIAEEMFLKLSLE